LAAAAEYGRTDVVRILLEYGANVNIHDDLGHIALCHASEAGHIDIVKALVEHSARTEMVNHVGHTPVFLHLATRS